MTRLLYVGQRVADDLRGGVDANLARYVSGDFLDLESAGDWRIPLSLDVDLSQLAELKVDGTPSSEIENSLIVGHALGALSPSVARENRVWVRMSHVECLTYSRARWIRSDASDETKSKSIKAHFFAPTIAACRDDHSVSRLWWNYHIARQIDASNVGVVLKLLLHRADIRLNFLERSGMASRPSFARGVVRLLDREIELLQGEDLFRRFMKRMNLDGAGIAFEILPDSRVDRIMQDCLEKVRHATKTSQERTNRTMEPATP